MLYNPKQNPEMRKLLRQAKQIATNAPVGTKLMCPCGCGQEYHKKQGQIFQNAATGNHKDKYHNNVRSTANHALDGETLELRRKLKAYIHKHFELLDVFKRNNKPSVKANKVAQFVMPKSLPKDFSSDNMIKVMELNKEVSAVAKVGSQILCSCGCGDIITKNTYQQVFSQKRDKQCKDDFHNKVRGSMKIEDSQSNIKAFEALKKNIKEQYKLIKSIQNNENDENNKPKSRRKIKR